MKPLVYILSLFLISGCTNSISENESFFGNWYACGKDGLYLEMVTQNDIYKYSTGEGHIGPWSKFSISGDTLIQYASDLYEDSIVINKAIIRYKSSDELTLDYLTSNEKWTLNRISGPVTADDDLKLLEETKRRAAIQKCTDQRTREEIVKDSLDMQNDLTIF